MLFNLTDAASWLLHYKYFVLFPAAIVEGPIATVLGGFLAAGGYLNIFWAYGIIVLGDLTGDGLWYWLGYSTRGKHIGKWGKFFGITDQRVERLETHFEKHSGKTLALGKISHGVGTVFLVAAGAAKMPFWKFIYYNLLGTLVKSAFLILIGYYFGHAIAKINSYLEFIADISIAIGLLLVVALFFYSRRKQKT